MTNYLTNEKQSETYECQTAYLPVSTKHPIFSVVTLFTPYFFFLLLTQIGSCRTDPITLTHPRNYTHATTSFLCLLTPNYYFLSLLVSSSTSLTIKPFLGTIIRFTNNHCPARVRQVKNHVQFNLSPKSVRSRSRWKLLNSSF